jgi:pilus assembly protein CpaE
VSTILLVAVDPEVRERVTSLPGHRVVSVDGRGGTASSGEQPAGLEPDLVLVGSGVSEDRALSYARQVLADWPDLAMVLVAAPNRGLVRRATKAGFVRVVDPATELADLARLVDDVTTSGEPSPPPPPPSAPPEAHRVVVVASPKGGVGKTTTAVNLTAVLAAAAPWEVVLIDLDLQFGDVSSMLDLQPEHTVVDAFASEGVDSMYVRTLLSTHPDGFYVLCGASGPADSAGVTGDQIRKLVSQLSASFHHVVIDTSAGLLEETLSSLEEASDVVMVTALDVATLRSTRKALDVLGDLGLIPSGRHLLLNRADRRSGLTVRDAERMLGLPVTAVVPLSDRIALAANHGELAVDVKRAPLRKPLQALAAEISQTRTVHHLHRGEKLT